MRQIDAPACISDNACISYLVMEHRIVLLVNVAFIFGALICSPTFAQTTWKAEHCQSLATESEPAGPKVVIDDVVLDGTTDVAESVWKTVVFEAKGEIFSGDDWVGSIKELSLRSRLRNQGYFKADVTAEGEIVSSSPALEHVVVHARVRGGTRYTLSGVRFKGVYPDEHLAFSEEELRPLIPLQKRDIFSAEKVSEGLEALMRYYGSHGYIDFVPSPEFEVDEMHQQIALVLSLQEGLQFRLGNIEIVGLDSPLETELRSKIMSGEILNYQLIADFYRDHRSELPEEVLPEDTQLRRNVKERTVDALFDFRSCSQLLQN